MALGSRNDKLYLGFTFSSRTCIIIVHIQVWVVFIVVEKVSMTIFIWISCRKCNRELIIHLNLFSVTVDQFCSMAAQPFHRMAPVPPHLTYKPEVSTYMDHFRNPIQPPQKRAVMPPQVKIYTYTVLHIACNDCTSAH